jgi:hypothetical protein
MIADDLRERLEQEPFEPFRIIASSGREVIVSNPGLVVMMKSAVFIAEPNSDRWAHIPYLHIAALESGGPMKRGRKRRAG